MLHPAELLKGNAIGLPKMIEKCLKKDKRQFQIAMAVFVSRLLGLENVAKDFRWHVLAESFSGWVKQMEQEPEKISRLLIIFSRTAEYQQFNKSLDRLLEQCLFTTAYKLLSSTSALGWFAEWTRPATFSRLRLLREASCTLIRTLAEHCRKFVEREAELGKQTLNSVRKFLYEAICVGIDRMGDVDKTIRQKAGQILVEIAGMNSVIDKKVFLAQLMALFESKN